ncbi:thermonuclease family protein [bacterium]|nr:thermonuclease family protein [bacterium]
MYKRFCAIFIFLFLIMAIIGCQEETEILVSRVIDGDTIDLADGITIRYIGINTPEVGQPGAEEATEANRALVEGKKVKLEYDVQKQDKYDRTLAYVYLEDGTFVNAELVKQGYAQVATYPPNVKYVDLFQKVQKEAQAEKLGLWAGESPKEPAEPTTKEQPPNQGKSDIVYITNTGEKYHRAGCRYLKKSSIPISRSEAIARGYTACKVCKP